MSGGTALLAILSVVGYVLLKHCCHGTSFRWDAQAQIPTAVGHADLGSFLPAGSRVTATPAFR